MAWSAAGLFTKIDSKSIVDSGVLDNSLFYIDDSSRNIFENYTTFSITSRDTTKINFKTASKEEIVKALFHAFADNAEYRKYKCLTIIISSEDHLLIQISDNIMHLDLIIIPDSASLKFFAAGFTTSKTGPALTQLEISDFESAIIARDTTPPTVVSHTPADDAVNVDVNNPITITFSEEVDLPASATYGPNWADAWIEQASTHAYSSKVLTITPNLPFPYSTSILVTSPPTVKDQAGNLLPSSSFRFTTEAAPDTTAPIETSKTPADGALNIGVDSSVSITFSEKLDPATAVKANIYQFQPTSASSPIDFSLSYDDDSNTIMLTPADSLEYSTEYKVYFTDGITDLAGNKIVNTNWKFTTEAAPDSINPNIVSITPSTGSNTAINKGEDVLVDSSFSVVFDEDVIVPSTAFLFFNEDDVSTNIPHTVSYDSSTYTATITPSSNLAHGKKHYLTLSNPIFDTAGNSTGIPGWLPYEFLTDVAPDTTAPIETSKTPASGATNVSVNTPVTITFSEKLDPTTAVKANVYQFQPTSDSAPIDFSLSYDDNSNTIVLTPADSLEYSTEYKVYFTDGITDLAGNKIVNTNWKFTTKNNPVQVGINTKSKSNDNSISVNLGPNIDYESIDSSSFEVKDKDGNIVSGTLDIDTTTGEIQFIPDVPLDNSDGYDIFLSGIQDKDGNTISDQSISFTNTTITPEIGIENSESSNDGSISVNLGTDVDLNSVNENTFQVIDSNGNLIPGTFVKDEDTGEVQFIPNTPFEEGTEYEVVLTGIQDKNGNVVPTTSTTFAQDTTPPEVAMTDAETFGANDFPIDRAIEIELSSDIDYSTISTDSFQILDEDGNPISGSISFSSSGVRFIPTESFEPNTRYQVSLTSDIKDNFGNSLSNTSWFFTTGEAPEDSESESSSDPAESSSDGSDSTESSSDGSDESSTSSSTETSSISSSSSTSSTSSGSSTEIVAAQSAELASLTELVTEILDNSTVMEMEPITDDNTIGDLQNTTNILLDELKQMQGFLTNMLPMIASLQQMQGELQTLLPLLGKVNTLEEQMQDTISATEGGTIYGDLRIQGKLYLTDDPTVE
jgi:methionine-rich copper-binding protein CopC